MRRTRATLRRAEFGFFGVVVYTRVHTPRRWGQACRAGVFLCFTTFFRATRISWHLFSSIGVGKCSERSHSYNGYFLLSSPFANRRDPSSPSRGGKARPPASLSPVPDRRHDYPFEQFALFHCRSQIISEYVCSINKLNECTIYFYVKKYFIFREKKHLLHAKKSFFTCSVFYKRLLTCFLKHHTLPKKR